MICNRTNRLLNLFFKLSKKLETETQRKSETEADLVARFCNGIFFWKIEKFSQKFDRMRNSEAIYSAGFYSSPNGYKVKSVESILKVCSEYIQSGAKM